MVPDALVRIPKVKWFVYLAVNMLIKTDELRRILMPINSDPVTPLGLGLLLMNKPHSFQWVYSRLEENYIFFP